MEIGIISDIHVDINYQADDTVEHALIQTILKNKLDILIIAGDLSNDYKKSLETINLIEHQTGIRCLFVPGNHDLWNKENPDIKNTNDIINALSLHGSCLLNNPIELTNDVVLIGDTGWYDYTFGLPSYTTEQYSIGFHRERQWKDKEYVNWNIDDIEKTRQSILSLSKQINSFRDKKVIVVTHMLTHEAFKVPLPNVDWEYFNAFLGSNSYQNIFTENVKFVIMGHVHYRKNLSENDIQYYCRCLGYRKEWQEQNAINEIEKTMEILTI